MSPIANPYLKKAVANPYAKKKPGALAAVAKPRPFNRPGPTVAAKVGQSGAHGGVRPRQQPPQRPQHAVGRAVAQPAGARAQGRQQHASRRIAPRAPPSMQGQKHVRRTLPAAPAPPMAATASGQSKKRPSGVSLKAQLKRQIAELKMAKIRKKQEKENAKFLKEMEERRKRDEAAMAVARKEREIQRAKEEAERLVIQVRSTVGMVLREMVDAVATRNGESPPQPPPPRPTPRPSPPAAVWSAPVPRSTAFPLPYPPARTPSSAAVAVGVTPSPLQGGIASSGGEGNGVPSGKVLSFVSPRAKAGVNPAEEVSSENPAGATLDQPIAPVAPSATSLLHAQVPWLCSDCGRTNPPSRARCAKPCYRWRGGVHPHVDGRPARDGLEGGTASATSLLHAQVPWLCSDCGRTNPPSRARCGKPCYRWRGGIHPQRQDLAIARMQNPISLLGVASTETVNTTAAVGDGGSASVHPASDRSVVVPPSLLSLIPRPGASAGGTATSLLHAQVPWMCSHCGTSNPPSRARCGKPCYRWRGGIHPQRQDLAIARMQQADSMPTAGVTPLDPGSGSASFVANDATKVIPRRFAQVVAPAARRPQTAMPPRTAEPRSEFVHGRPLVAPSPFASTHKLIEAPITVIKDAGGSFGVTLRLSTQSTLVEPPPLPSLPTGTAQTKAPRRQRRRRVFFSVVTVAGAEKQNARKDGPKKDVDVLHPGDIVCSVDGRDVGGMTFQGVISLFGAASTPAESTASGPSKIIQCHLSIARRVTPPLTPLATQIQPLPLPTQPSFNAPIFVSENGEVISGDFSDAELKSVVDGLTTVRKFGDFLIPKRANQTLDFLSSVKAHPSTGNALSRRDEATIGKKLSSVKLSLDKKMKVLAQDYWRKQWRNECVNDEQLLARFDFLSDAQRTSMRQLPRPAQGCKCGGLDHQYVNDEKCPLYLDVVPHVTREELEAVRPAKQKRPKKSESDTISAIGNALMERRKKVLEEQEAERREALFVELMEKTQIEKMRKAIFAPGLLEVAIISTVAALMSKYSLEEADESSSSIEAISAKVEEGATEGPTKTDASDDEDDDDIPLTALGSSEPPKKKQKAEPTYPSSAFLAEMLFYISSTWGHVIQENDTHADYAWHLKLGALNCDQSVDQLTQNPRQPGSLSFEHIKFLVKEFMTPRIKSTPKSSQSHNSTPADPLKTSGTSAASDTVAGISAAGAPDLAPSHSDGLVTKASTIYPLKDELQILLLSSQEATGLFDEVMGLVGSDVLHICSDGKVVLKRDWQFNVGASVILDAEERGWFKGDDPANVFCLHDSLRSLTDFWEQRNGGWGLIDEPDEEAEFINEEYFDIKRDFAKDYSNHYDGKDGVGNFGI